MTEDEYVHAVLDENKLSETAEFLRTSNEEVYYADRHVPEVPPGLPHSIAFVAGIRLLQQWNLEAASLRVGGLFTSAPTLVVDDDWLKMHPEAAPPHIVITLALNAKSVEKGAIDLSIPGSETPLDHLIEGPQKVIAKRIDPRVEFDLPGAWLFQIEVASPPPLHNKTVK